MDFTAADVKSYETRTRLRENVIALNAIRRRRVYNSVDNHFLAFFNIADTNR